MQTKSVSLSKTIATLGLAAVMSMMMLAGCSSESSSTASEENTNVANENNIVENAINEPLYSTENVYYDTTVKDIIDNSDDVESMIEYLVIAGATRNNDNKQATWNGADGITKFTLKDFDDNTVTFDESKTAEPGSIILQIDAMMPQELSAIDVICTLTGVDRQSFVAYEEIDKDDGDIAIAALQNEDKCIYLVGQRTRGNDSPGFILNAYLFGSSTELAKTLKLDPDVSPEFVVESYAESIQNEDNTD